LKPQYDQIQLDLQARSNQVPLTNYLPQISDAKGQLWYLFTESGVNQNFYNYAVPDGPIPRDRFIEFVNRVNTGAKRGVDLLALIPGV
jgi:hypothetical protein